MNTTPDLDALINRFRIAARELFNTYFRVDDPYKNNGWSGAERFSDVEVLLFEKLVAEVAGLSIVGYGNLQPEIRVSLRQGLDHAPIMINRETDSGYWDHPIREVTPDAKLVFIRFFDWDQLDYRDNRYVRVQVEKWASHPEIEGKQALVNAGSVRFGRAP
jgi:hypothetical protein